MLGKWLADIEIPIVGDAEILNPVLGLWPLSSPYREVYSTKVSNRYHKLHQVGKHHDVTTLLRISLARPRTPDRIGQARSLPVHEHGWRAEVTSRLYIIVSGTVLSSLPLPLSVCWRPLARHSWSWCHLTRGLFSVRPIGWVGERRWE